VNWAAAAAISPAGRDKWCSTPPSVPKYKLPNNYCTLLLSLSNTAQRTSNDHMLCIKTKYSN
jgi:hypothetical protein